MSKFSERFRSRFSGFPSVSQFDNDETPYEARLRQYRDHMEYMRAAHAQMEPMVFTMIGGQQVIVR